MISIQECLEMRFNGIESYLWIVLEQTYLILLMNNRDLEILLIQKKILIQKYLKYSNKVSKCTVQNLI